MVVFEQTMAWILDEYSKFHGYSPAVVTGKPIVSILELNLKPTFLSGFWPFIQLQTSY